MNNPNNIEEMVLEAIDIIGDEVVTKGEQMYLSGSGEERLRQLFLTQRKEVEEAEREKYNELIMAVESKHKGETRHETALRYIRQAEMSSPEALKGQKLESKE